MCSTQARVPASRETPSPDFMKYLSHFRHLLGMLAAITLFVLSACSLPPDPSSPQLEDYTPTPPVIQVKPDDLVTVLPRDAIQAITSPAFDSVDEAQPYMRSDEQVIGLALNGDVRAYPINILSRHEIVNDVVGGEPVAITWCPLCYSALVFSRRVNGRELTFGVSGKLYENNLIMYDHQTESLWSQLLGQAVAGSLRGARLALKTASQTTWENWRVEHPDSLVLSKPKTLRVFYGTAEVKDPMYNYSVDRYRSYYASRDRGLVNRNIPEESNVAVKQRVLGLRIADDLKAYFFTALAQESVVNDTVAGLPVLITFDVVSENGAGFDRRLDGQVLTFRLAEAGERLILRDEQTNSRWNGLTGQAISGPLKGRQLRRLLTTYAFWFAWKAHFPETQVYR
ncbi:MAG: DUF3179 domain-containing protein [Chloroflexi bacterium]|nr:MAG: DUF3179 domain-containing protein [Chloroflexota bacterium]